MSKVVNYGYGCFLNIKRGWYPGLLNGKSFKVCTEYVMFDRDVINRVPSSQLINSLTFPDFLMRLFPDFPWLYSSCLMNMRSAARRKNPGKHLVWGKVHINQGWNLVHLRAKFPYCPWPSTKFPDFPWLSWRKFFPRFSLMLGILYQNWNLKSRK